MSVFGKSIPLIGLGIETNTFRVVQLKSSPGLPLLTSYGSIKIPVGAAVEGEIVDADAISQSLSQLWRKTGLREKRVIVGLANQKVVVRLIELPYMPKEELKNTIRYQASEYIPIPVEEAILDHQVVNESVTEAGERMMEVLIVAAQKDMVQNTIRAVEKAGLKPEVIDVSSFAIVRSLMSELSLIPEEEELEAQEKATALINIGAGITNIVVVEESIPRFTRVISLAGNNFTQSIANALSISFDEAEELKVQLGLPPLEATKVDFSKELAEKAPSVQEVLKKEYSKFLSEVKRSLDYYLAQTTKAREIKRVIVSGGSSQLKNLVAYLEKGLRVDVELGHPLSKVKIASHLNEEELIKEEASLAISIGLALRGFQQ